MLPARYAQVVLLGVSSASDLAAMTGASSEHDALAAAMKQMNLEQTETARDGSYLLSDVAPGDYYVMATMPGYLQPASHVQSLLREAEEKMGGGLSTLQTVRVAEGKTADVSIVMSKGGVVEGRVQWDDGPGVASAVVELVPPKDDLKALAPQFLMLTNKSLGAGSTLVTDDQGHFRIVGVESGTYVLKVSFQSRARVQVRGGVLARQATQAEDPLVVYGSAAFFREDAALITVKGQGDTTNLDVTINQRELHTVKGSVVGSDTGAPVNGGSISLRSDDHTGMSRTAHIETDGTFIVDNVPSGNYTLLVRGASEDPTAKVIKVGATSVATRSVRKSYPPGSRKIVVLDSDLVLSPIEIN